jgi:hypothetical protein
MSENNGLSVLIGEVEKAYNPKRGSNKFFFTVRDQDSEEHRGMALAHFMTAIRCHAVVEIKGRVNRGWWNPVEVRVLREPDLSGHVNPEALDIAHVGSPRPTHWGLGCSTKLEDETWLTIPCSVMVVFFDDDTQGADRAFPFPGRGRGVLSAEVYRRDGEAVVTKIEGFEPLSKKVELDIAFSKIYWSPDGHVRFKINGDWMTMPWDDLPIEVEAECLATYPKLDGWLHFEGTMVAHSEGVHKIGWTWLEFTVTVESEIAARIRDLLWSNKVARATRAVRKQLDDLVAKGVVVDLSMVEQLFLAQGVKPNKDKVEQVWSRGYDMRYIRALQELAEPEAEVWRCVQGFLFHIGSWIVWEPAIENAATYIVPDTPNDALTGEALSLAEWASVLGRVLPGTHKMSLRYGEVGQALSGSVEGVQFAFHVQDDEGNIDGWVDAVKAVVSGVPIFEADLSVPDLDSLVALYSGEGEQEVADG